MQPGDPNTSTGIIHEAIAESSHPHAVPAQDAVAVSQNDMRWIVPSTPTSPPLPVIGDISVLQEVFRFPGSLSAFEKIYGYTTVENLPSHDRFIDLGRACLSLITMVFLRSTYPRLTTMTLAMMRSHLLDNAVLETYGRLYKLQDLMAAVQGREVVTIHSNILGVLFEAYIGALYESYGTPVIQEFGNKLFVSHAEELYAAITSTADEKLVQRLKEVRNELWTQAVSSAQARQRTTKKPEEPKSIKASHPKLAALRKTLDRRLEERVSKATNTWLSEHRDIAKDAGTLRGRMLVKGMNEARTSAEAEQLLVEQDLASGERNADAERTSEPVVDGGWESARESTSGTIPPALPTKEYGTLSQFEPLFVSGTTLASLAGEAVVESSSSVLRQGTSASPQIKRWIMPSKPAFPPLPRIEDRGIVQEVFRTRTVRGPDKPTLPGVERTEKDLEKNTGLALIGDACVSIAAYAFLNSTYPILKPSLQAAVHRHLISNFAFERYGQIYKLQDRTPRLYGLDEIPPESLATTFEAYIGGTFQAFGMHTVQEFCNKLFLSHAQKCYEALVVPPDQELVARLNELKAERIQQHLASGEPAIPDRVLYDRKDPLNKAIKAIQSKMRHKHPKGILSGTKAWEAEHFPEDVAVREEAMRAAAEQLELRRAARLPPPNPEPFTLIVPPHVEKPDSTSPRMDLLVEQLLMPSKKPKAPVQPPLQQPTLRVPSVTPLPQPGSAALRRVGRMLSR